MSIISDDHADSRQARLLLITIFLVAICGLVYELIAGTLSSYLLGDSVTQFSLVIGVFLTAMGIGSYLSKFIHDAPLARLIAIEMCVGLIGGLTALIGFAVFAFTEAYQPVFIGLVTTVGILIGLEVPLVIRIMKSMQTLPMSLAHVLSADYLGALVASLLFPFALLPHLGLIRAGVVMGLVNVLVALLLLYFCGHAVGKLRRRLWVLGGAAVVVLAGAVILSERLVGFMENRIYQDEVILARDTGHQRIVVTRWRNDIRMYLNGHLQFSSIDEHRYHEALVHPAMHMVKQPERVLILGGGDGLAAREVRRHNGVRRIDVVDLDPVVTELFSTRSMFRELNDDAFADPRVHVHNQDAMRFLEDTAQRYDVVIMDLPDPSSPGVAKLYSRAFFNLVGRRLTSGGMVASQCTSPFRSRAAFWCIVHTFAEARCGPLPQDRFEVRPYHTVVPTFGTWGFVVAGREVPDPAAIKLAVPTRYLTDATLPGLFTFPADMAEVPTAVSRLDDPVVSRLYVSGYHKYLD